MLADLKVSPLACKCIFYESEHNAKGEGVIMELNFAGLQMQK